MSIEWPSDYLHIEASPAHAGFAKLTLADGTELKGVTQVDITIRAGEVIYATVQMIVSNVDVVARISEFKAKQIGNHPLSEEEKSNWEQINNRLRDLVKELGGDPNAIYES